MSFEINGTLITRSEIETKGESFRVRTFGIKVNEGGQYDNYASFQLTQDRCGLIDGFNKGDEIKVHFDVRGRLWEGKVFTNFNAWRVERLNNASESHAPKPEPKPEPVAATEGENLPF